MKPKLISNKNINISKKENRFTSLRIYAQRVRQMSGDEKTNRI